MMNALHIVGFVLLAIGPDDRRDYAARIFGPPDFIHRVWDARVHAEIMPSDRVVFAKRQEFSPLTPFAFDDSENQ